MSRKPRFGERLRRAAASVARATVLPALLFGLSGYFYWHSIHGERGLRAQERIEGSIDVAKADLRRAEQEMRSYERRVAGLRGDQMDRDALDERARASLGLTSREDLVIPYPSNKRLY